MGLPRSNDSEERFAAYVEGLRERDRACDRVEPLRYYCVGLMLPGARKSVEPMAAITAPERTAAEHQSLLHFVGQGPWSDETALAKVREGAAGDDARRADRGVDRRRHRLSQEGSAFDRRGAAVLRAVGQAGQLPGGGLVVDRQSRCELAGGLSGRICRRSGRAIANVGAR